MASRCAAGRSSTAAWTDLATEPATAVSSGSGAATGGAASAVRRRRAAERRTQSTARRWVMMPSQRRHDPRAGSNACGSLHTRTKTSWVMSWAAAQSQVTRTASPYTSGENSSYSSPSAAWSPARGVRKPPCPTAGARTPAGPPRLLLRVSVRSSPPQLPKWCERYCQGTTPCQLPPPERLATHPTLSRSGHPTHRRCGVAAPVEREPELRGVVAVPCRTPPSWWARPRREPR
jgi:hypothetical protein